MTTIINKNINNIYIIIDFKKYSIFLASIMFIWSGIDKIINFNKKISTLSNKIKLYSIIYSIGIVLVILLEIIGFLLLVEYFFNLKIFYNLINKINIFIRYLFVPLKHL